MAELTRLRQCAREIFDAALRAVDARKAVISAIKLEDSNLFVGDRKINCRDRPIYSVAIGKASPAMAGALEEQLGLHFTRGVISGPKLDAARPDSSRWQYFQGGHPLPNQNSFDAAAAVFALLEKANRERALVIFLISGGGSAMIEWPAGTSITLEDVRSTNKILVNCGADIIEVNSLRRTFSAIKGGRLAQRAPNCDQVTLIISDVPPGQGNYVASGPTVLPSPHVLDAKEILRKYSLADQLPPSIVDAIENPLPENSIFVPPEPSVLLDNHTALEAGLFAAKNLCLACEIAEDITDKPIDSGCESLIQRLRELQKHPLGDHEPLCLLSGGEFLCPVKGNGIGGRNLETALRLAVDVSLQEQEFVALCAGTDGIDGNSSVAGALVDNTTIARAMAMGLNAEDFLARSDSFSFFHALGDDVITGPTGTNVRDIRILLTA